MGFCNNKINPKPDWSVRHYSLSYQYVRSLLKNKLKLSYKRIVSKPVRANMQKVELSKNYLHKVCKAT